MFIMKIIQSATFFSLEYLLYVEIYLSNLPWSFCDQEFRLGFLHFYYLLNLPFLHDQLPSRMVDRCGLSLILSRLHLLRLVSPFDSLRKLLFLRFYL